MLKAHDYLLKIDTASVATASVDEVRPTPTILVHRAQNAKGLRPFCGILRMNGLPRCSKAASWQGQKAAGRGCGSGASVDVPQSKRQIVGGAGFDSRMPSALPSPCGAYSRNPCRETRLARDPPPDASAQAYRRLQGPAGSTVKVSPSVGLTARCVRYTWLSVSVSATSLPLPLFRSRW